LTTAAGSFFGSTCTGNRSSALPRTIAPGETIHCLMTLPLQQAGRYVIELDCVSARVAWFSPLGSRTVRLPVEVLGG
jgi:hypothetical protein